MSIDTRSDALYYACILLSNSEEASATKKAAQAIHIAEMLEEWISKGTKPEFSGNVELVYYSKNPRTQSNGQSNGRGNGHVRHDPALISYLGR